MPAAEATIAALRDGSAAAPAVRTVFTEVLRRGPVARVAVAQRTGLSPAAVTKAVNRLMERGLISTHDAEPSVLPGRPVQPISVHESARLVLGVVVRADELYGVATTIRTRVLHAVRLPLADTSVTTVLDGVDDAVRTLLHALGDDADLVIGTGIAVSGDVDKVHGMVRASARLGWTDVALVEALRGRVPTPVVLENDVRALAIAEEWFGIGLDAGSFAIVTIGAGIGCGLFANGAVVEGAFGVAGELGHLPLAPQDAVCTCGRLGCVEAVASSAAILTRVRAAKGDAGIDLDGAVDLARAGDADARAAFDDAGDLIGRAIAAMANLIGPSTVLVAGEAVTNYDLFEQRVRTAFTDHAFGAASACTIVTRTHTFEDWARGAAASVLHALLHHSIDS